MFLTGWFPHKYDPQLAVFVKKHAQAAAIYHNVYLLYIRRDESLQKDIEMDLQVEGRLHTLVLYYRSGSTLFKVFPYYRATVAGLNALLDRVIPDLIHINITGVCALPIIFNAYRKIPVVVTEHGSYHLRPERIGRTQKWFIKRAFKKAKAITAVSGFLAKIIQRNYRIKNVQLIPNVVESTRFDRTLPANGLFKILLVCDLNDEIKNISDVITVVRQLVLEGNNIRLDIIGGGEDEQRLKENCGHDLDKHIYFYGRQKNEYVLDAMHHCDFYITNSRIETFSVATLEAIMAGKPVIVTRCGGPEDFMKEDFGYMIDTDAPDQLKEAILKMMKNFGEFEKDEMYKFVKTHYSREVIASQLNELYQKVLKS